MNITLTSKITEDCFNWCKEQHFIHQNNLEIYDLNFIVIALVSLVVHNSTDNERLHDATYFLTYIMLISYLLYMVFLK